MKMKITVDPSRLSKGKAAQPPASPPVPLDVLQKEIDRREAVERELNNAETARDEALVRLGNLEAEIARLKNLATSPAASPEDVKKLEDVASAMNTAVDGIIKLIAETKVIDGSPAAQAIDEAILPALEKLDTLLPRTN